MGSFSWTRAEHTTKRANIANGDSYKILVPLEFGGGYVKDVYFGYGIVFENGGKYVDKDGHTYSGFGENDLYGILAYWNGLAGLKYNGDKPKTMVEILKNGDTISQENRSIGIDFGCYKKEIDKLKYPLKLVSASYKYSYEDCKGKSYGDPNQGFGKYYWSDKDYASYLDILVELETS